MIEAVRVRILLCYLAHLDAFRGLIRVNRSSYGLVKSCRRDEAIAELAFDD